MTFQSQQSEDPTLKTATTDVGATEAKALEGSDDWELPSQGASGAACGLGDGATCEACQ